MNSTAIIARQQSNTEIMMTAKKAIITLIREYQAEHTQQRKQGAR